MTLLVRINITRVYVEQVDFIESFESGGWANVTVAKRKTMLASQVSWNIRCFFLFAFFFNHGLINLTQLIKMCLNLLVHKDKTRGSEEVGQERMDDSEYMHGSHLKDKCPFPFILIKPVLPYQLVYCTNLFPTYLNHQLRYPPKTYRTSQSVAYQITL